MTTQTLDPPFELPHQAVGAASLRDLPIGALDDLFATLQAPLPGSLVGVLEGTLLSTFLEEKLGFVIGRAARDAIRASLMPWVGKSFEGTRGANVWLSGSGRLTLGSYALALGEALDGTGEVLRLSYDVPENISLLRPVLGEVRELGPGLFVGRMWYRGGGRPVRVLYFLLEA